MEGNVNIKELMSYMRQNDLVIINRKELIDLEYVKVQQLKSEALKKPWLSLKEIIDAQFFVNVKSKGALQHWIRNGKIKPGDYTKNAQGEIRILTSVIKKLAYVND
jgi:hypothetical protein